MGKTQWITFGAAVLVVLLMFFVLPTKPGSFRKIEQTRQVSLKSTDIQAMLAEARSRVHGPEANRIIGLESELEKGDPDAALLKALSSAWFSLNERAIAGYYAALVAEQEGTAEAWSIAGTTYSMALQESKEDKVRRFSLEQGVEAFEKAISLEPESNRHRLNLALLYTEMPPENNPMQGIQMLLDLQKQAPEDAAVLFHLGRLAIKTGQAEKAVERLSRAAELRPDHPETWLLLASALEMSGDMPAAERARAQWEKLN